MSRCSSRSRVTADLTGPHISQLRHRIRGDHCSLQQKKPLQGRAPPAPPALEEREVRALRQVWHRLDVDADGVLSPSDLYRAVRSHGLRGVSRQDAYDMLWEASLQPEPGLMFDQFVGAYAQAKANRSGQEPRRLYNYIVYSLMDTDLNGTISADEVYTHFYSYSAEPGFVAGATWLLQSMPAGEEEQVSPGLFVRYMQSGALSSVAPASKSLSRPSSAPPTHVFKPAPPRMTAMQKFEDATAEMRREEERRKYDSFHDVCDTSNLSTLDLRRSRDCLIRGVTDVWGQREEARKAGIRRLEAMRKTKRGMVGHRNALKTDPDDKAIAAAAASAHDAGSTS